MSVIKVTPPPLPPGDALFNLPSGVAEMDDDLYVAEQGNCCIRKVTSDRAAITFVGSTAFTGGHVDDTGTAARFNIPNGVTVIGTDLYVADSYNHCIRKVTAAGVVTTFAGTTGTTSGHTDDTGTAARFSAPTGIIAVGTDLYVADSSNHCIRKITSAGVVTTFAGTTGTTSGQVNDTGTAARFFGPSGITAIGTDLYVTEYANHCVRKVTSAGVVTTLAGSPALDGSSIGHIDATGTTARFYAPNGITAIGASLYVCDRGNQCIRKVTSAGVVTTFAGTTGTTSGHTDAIGTAARFNDPRGIGAVGTDLYVCDTANHCIRKIATPSAAVTTLVGRPTVAGHLDAIYVSQTLDLEVIG